MIDVKLLEEINVIKAKIRKQKINTIPEMEKYSDLFDEYIQLSKKLFGTEEGKGDTMKIKVSSYILQFLKGIVARMETENGYVLKTYETEDIKRDLLQLLCKIEKDNS